MNLTAYETKIHIGLLLWMLLMGVIWCLPVSCMVKMIVAGGWLAILLLISANVVWWRPRVAKHLPILLMLHSVSDAVVDTTCANNTVRPSELEALIQSLLNAGYTFYFAKEVLDTPPQRAVVLTFDDGYVDNYLYLFPILKRYNVKATCFVTNEGIEDPAFLSEAQIQEMQASGLVEFGGHTACHTVLDKLPKEEARQAIVQNRDYLTRVLGRAPVTFAYPCGGYTQETINLVKAAGYRAAFTMHKKMQLPSKDLYRVHRQIIPRGVKPWQAYFLATRGRYKL